MTAVMLMGGLPRVPVNLMSDPMTMYATVAVQNTSWYPPLPGEAADAYMARVQRLSKVLTDKFPARLQNQVNNVAKGTGTVLALYSAVWFEAVTEWQQGTGGDLQAWLGYIESTDYSPQRQRLESSIYADVMTAFKAWCVLRCLLLGV